MEPIKSGFRYNLDRYVAESLTIERGKLDQDVNLMNSKSEFGNKGLPRIRITNQNLT